MARKRASRSLFHHYFLPSAHNAHKPLFLSLPASATVAGIILLLFLIALGLERLVLRSPSPQVGAVVTSVLVELANADREESGTRALAVNSILEQAAQMKADDMAEKEYFAHDSPLGLKPWHWFEKAGYAYSSAGENLAVFFNDSAEVEKAWMDSPLHRANILGDQFTEIGIALAHGTFEGEETTFVVQMFGSPAIASAAAGTPATASVVATPQETQVPQVLEGDTVAGASAQVERSVAAAPSSNFAWRILTAPTTTLQYIYVALGVLILLATTLLFTVELKRLHVPSLIRGVGLVALIAVLLWSGTTYFSGELLVL